MVRPGRGDRPRPRGSLLPVLVSGGFAIANDSFIYCALSEWLQTSALDDVPQWDPASPLTHFPSLWQGGVPGAELREAPSAGAAYILALVQAARGGSVSLLAFPGTSALGILTLTALVFSLARSSLRRPTRWAAVCALAFAALPHPLLWAHHRGFLQQTLGLPVVFAIVALAPSAGAAREAHGASETRGSPPRGGGQPLPRRCANRPGRLRRGRSQSGPEEGCRPVPTRGPRGRGPRHRRRPRSPRPDDWHLEDPRTTGISPAGTSPGRPSTGWAMRSASGRPEVPPGWTSPPCAGRSAPLRSGGRGRPVAPKASRVAAHGGRRAARGARARLRPAGLGPLVGRPGAQLESHARHPVGFPGGPPPGGRRFAPRRSSSSRMARPPTARGPRARGRRGILGGGARPRALDEADLRLRATPPRAGQAAESILALPEGQLLLVGRAANRGVWLGAYVCLIAWPRGVVGLWRAVAAWDRR